MERYSAIVGDGLTANDDNDDAINNGGERDSSKLMKREYDAVTGYRILIQIVYDLPVEVSLGLFALLCTWSMLSLTCFHALLITVAQTTNERVRGVYQYGGVENPDDLGCWRNWSTAFCSRMEESRLPDFSEVARLPEGRGKESVWVDWKVDESFTSLITPELDGDAQ